MAKTVLFERQPAAYAMIDWQKTTDLCSDVYCACGEQAHHCTHGDCGSAQHLRCPHCKKVIRLAERVELFRHRDSCNNSVPNPCAYVQWKGTEVTLTANCPCGTKTEVKDKDFFYDFTCPSCRQAYHTAWNIAATVLSDEEAAGVSPIHAPQRDDDEEPEA